MVESYGPCETLGRPVHHPPEHRHDAIWDVAPRLVAGLWYAVIEKNEGLCSDTVQISDWCYQQTEADSGGHHKPSSVRDMLPSC